MASKKNRNGVLKLDDAVKVSSSVPAETYHGIVTFATDSDRHKFGNRFGNQKFFRTVVKAKYGATPVSYEQAAEVARPAEELLKKLLDRNADGSEGHCALGEKCKNPRFKFVPFSEHQLDWSDSLQPKHAVLKVWDGEELVTVLKVALPSGASKIYHSFADGRVSKKERGETVFVSLDEAKMVVAEGEPILLFSGRFLVDRVNRSVVGPICYHDEEAMREKYGKAAPRLTSKAVAEAEVSRLIAQDEADKQYQLQREARAKEKVRANEGALDDLLKRTRKPVTDGRPGSGKMRRTENWGKKFARQ